MTEVRARPVMGPVVSSERTTSRKGLRKTLGSISASSKKKKKTNKRVFIVFTVCKDN